GYYDAVGSLALPPICRCPTKPQLKPDVQAEYVMRRLLTLALIFSTLAFSSGCVYRANISQGNLLEQEDLDQVEIGMTRNQVRFLLGTPLIDDPFHQERWDYIYYIRIGRDDATFKRWVTIVFADDIVTELRTDQELDPNL
ncbi:MAG: outer membrane protein assembly factor BamE, partial [Gammaproteobacteria bacterium]|nr:outer membrane protein assembly factor BamE [Gammaproteobacteria bacterium]